MKNAALGLVLLAFSTPVTAQEGDFADFFKPAPELRKLDHMVGVWKGKGVSFTPDGQEYPWTSMSKASWTLGGHVLQDDLKVEVEGLGALVFRTLYAWDRENKKFIVYGFGNMGPAETLDMWIDGNTYYTLNTRTGEDGKPLIERGVSTYEGSKYSFVMEQSAAGAGFKTHVKGTGEKVDAEFKLKRSDFASSFQPTTSEMTGLNKVAGNYRYKGKVTPFPGSPPMEITGTETASVMLSGQLLGWHAKGDPAPGQPLYEGRSYMSWSDETNSYLHFYVDNMGGVSKSACYLVDDQIVGIGAGLQYGSPSANRMVIHVDESGQITSVTGDQLTATGPSIRTFEAKYTKAPPKPGKSGKPGASKAGAGGK